MGTGWQVSRRKPNGPFSWLPTPESQAKIPAILWTTDLTFAVTSLAGAGSVVTGVSTHQYLGLAVTSIFPNSNAALNAETAHLRASRGEGCNFDFELNGVEYRARVEPVRDSRGQIVAISGVAIDNTEACVEHRSLQNSAENYRVLIQ